MKKTCAEALGIHRKNIYRQAQQPARDEALKQAIEQVHREHPAYGHRRIAVHLQMNRKRAQRVMAKFNLRPPRRVKSYTTRSTPQHKYQNLLKSEPPILKRDGVWCSDVSRILYRGSIWYLATIEDMVTREVLARQMGNRHDSQLILALLRQAFATARRPRIFHSDQGTELMAQRCTDYLQQRGVQISVSDVASPWQNGYMESFYGRFKQELGDINRFDSEGQMIEAIYRHIHYYNHQRIHTALKMPPALYARNFHSDNGLHILGT